MFRPSLGYYQESSSNQKGKRLKMQHRIYQQTDYARNGAKIIRFSLLYHGAGLAQSV